MERRAFAYGRTFFYTRALLLMLLFTFALAFLGLQTTTPSSWIGALAVVLAIYLLIVGLSPLLTTHLLARSRLILRQGWYFHAVIPLADAESIGPYDGEPKFGLRVSIARHTLYVVGSATGLVAIRLKAPRRFAQVLFATAAEIVFDVDDREAFLAAVEDRRVEATALPAKKIPILPAARR